MSQRNEYMREYMREYRAKNGKDLYDKRVAREAYKKICQLDEQRGKAAAALKELLDEMGTNKKMVVLNLVARCTPMMLDELVGCAKEHTVVSRG